MREIEGISKIKYSKLYNFLVEKKLEIRHNLVATDLDCAYKIVDINHDFRSHKIDEIIICFLYLDDKEFLFNFLEKSMNESRFIIEISKKYKLKKGSIDFTYD